MRSRERGGGAVKGERGGRERGEGEGEGGREREKGEGGRKRGNQ